MPNAAWSLHLQLSYARPGALPPGMLGVATPVGAARWGGVRGRDAAAVRDADGGGVAGGAGDGASMAAINRGEVAIHTTRAEKVENLLI